VQAGQSLRPREQFIIESYGRPHGNIPSASIWHHLTRTSKPAELLSLASAGRAPSVTSTISGGTPRRTGAMLQPSPPETTTSQLIFA